MLNVNALSDSALLNVLCGHLQLHNYVILNNFVWFVLSCTEHGSRTDNEKEQTFFMFGSLFHGVFVCLFVQT